MAYYLLLLGHGQPLSGSQCVPLELQAEILPLCHLGIMCCLVLLGMEETVCECLPLLCRWMCPASTWDQRDPTVARMQPGMMHGPIHGVPHRVA